MTEGASADGSDGEVDIRGGVLDELDAGGARGRGRAGASV